MSQITNTDVEKLAELAMLEISDSEVASLVSSINNILGYVGMVATADLSDVKSKYNFTNVDRADDFMDNVGSHQIIMQNVREVSPEGFVEVSKVINK